MIKIRINRRGGKSENLRRIGFIKKLKSIEIVNKSMNTLKILQTFEKRMFLDI